MEDRHVVALAVAAWLGARYATSFPVPAGRVGEIGLAVLVLALLQRRWIVPVVVVVFLLAAVLGARSWAGLLPPSRSSSWAGDATLVTDPVRVGAGWKAEVRLAGGRRAEAFAYGRTASGLRDRLAGERVRGAGRLAAPPTTARARLAVHHVAVRLSLSACEPIGGTRPWSVAANGVRRSLLSGASSLAPDRRALWAGLVFGDDRDEDPGLEADFSVAGLSHLLSVSGQNVAFALAAAGPLLRRFGLRSRLAVSLAVLGLFGVAVRFEPSVLRASAMAALALTATALGVATSAVRLVGLAVTGLVLVDPLLVHRLGFQLSVAATVGIALWSRPLAARLPGPAALREALGTSLAAQAAVAPLLLGLGGTSPVSLPANVLAVPAAGPVMVWGLTGGLAAGVLGGPVAAALHVPDRVLLAWLAGVARASASVPLRPVAAAALAVTAGLVTLAVVAPARWRRWLVAAAAAVFVVPTALPVGAALGRSPTTGVSLWRSDGTTVVVVSAGDPGRVLAALQREMVDRIDLVAVDGSGTAGLAVVAAVADRHHVAALAGPPSIDVADLVVLDARHPVRAGPFVVSADDHHHVTVTRP